MLFWRLRLFVRYLQDELAVVIHNMVLLLAHHRPTWPPTHQVGKYLSKIKIREILAMFVAWVGKVYPYYPIWKIGAAFTQFIICLGGLIWEKYEPSLLAWVGKCIPVQHEIDMSLPHLHWSENVYPTWDRSEPTSFTLVGKHIPNVLKIWAYLIYIGRKMCTWYGRDNEWY